MEEHRKTTDADQVSKYDTEVYDMNTVAENTMLNGMNVMANPFFNMALNVASSLLVIAVMLFHASEMP